MDHKTVQSLLSSYVDRELGSDERASVEEHLARCGECGKHERMLRRLSADVAAAATYELPEGFAFGVLRSLKQEKERAAAWRPVEQLSRRLVLALSVAVIVFVTAGSLVQPMPPPVVETYLAGESGDSLAARTLMTEEQLSKDELLLAAVIR